MKNYDSDSEDNHKIQKITFENNFSIEGGRHDEILFSHKLSQPRDKILEKFLRDKQNRTRVSKYVNSLEDSLKYYVDSETLKEKINSLDWSWRRSPDGIEGDDDWNNWIVTKGKHTFDMYFNNWKNFEVMCVVKITSFLYLANSYTFFI